MRPLSEINETGKLVEYAKGVRQLQFASSQTLGDTARLVHHVVSLSDKTMPIKAYFDFVRQTQITEHRPGCFEDEFMLAIGFLGVEVSDLSAVIYLKGESPDFIPYKHLRKRLDTADSTVLKVLSSKLAKPNEERGRTEAEMIEASVKRLTNLNDLHQLVPEVVSRLKAGATKLDVMQQVRVGAAQEPMTRKDWDIISRMARRAKLYVFRQREKDPANAYELSTHNHKRVADLATKWTMSPRRALNRLLDDFWSIIERQHLFDTQFAKELPKKSAKRKAKRRKG